MPKVITLSRHFLKGHPKAGQPTHFIEKVFKSLDIPVENCGISPIDELILKTCRPKHHTIRFGRRWKDGDEASIRVWSGVPYRSPQWVISDGALRVVNIIIDYNKGEILQAKELIPNFFYVRGRLICYLSVGSSDLQMVAKNDGLSPQDMLDWFQVGKKKGVHEAQILIWGDVKEY